ncbi:MAG: hypothetical protein GDA36_08640 [Rhodobacteraceae bacterium]|nr:hypothetical protein [Paracoccaceae bacterium]
MKKFLLTAAALAALSACTQSLPPLKASAVAFDDEFVRVHSGEAYSNYPVERPETPQAEIDAVAVSVCARYGKKPDFVSEIPLQELLPMGGVLGGGLVSVTTHKHSLYACI